MPSATSDYGENGNTNGPTAVASNREPATANPEELSASIWEHLHSLDRKIATFGEEMLAKMDEMSTRLDGLESKFKALNTEFQQENTSTEQETPVTQTDAQSRADSASKT